MSRGPTFTAADVYVSSHLGGAGSSARSKSGPPLPGTGLSVSDRPAQRRASALDDALMPKAS